MKRKWLVILAAFVVVFLVIIVVLPFLIDVNQFRPKIETEMQSALGRKVEIGNISLSILSGGVAVDNVSIADDPAFSQEPFLRTKSLKVGVELMPLIFSRALRVKTFTVEEPEISLLRSNAGTWNFSSLGTSKKSAPRAKESSSSDFSVQELTVSNGRITIGSAGSRSKNQTYTDFNLHVTDLSTTTAFPFTLSTKAPGGGSIKLDGKAGPLHQSDASLTPVHANLDVQHFNLAESGILDPSTGMAGLLDFAGTLDSDGRQMKAKGKLNADKLQVAKGGAPCKEPVEVAYDTDYDLHRQAGALNEGDIRVGKAHARLTGTYNTSGPSTTVQMKLVGQNMPAQDVEALLPALGVTLPSGASLQSGSLSTDLAMSGPLDRLLTTGAVNLSDAKLANFDLGSKLGALGSFAGVQKGSDTTIQTLSSNLRVAPEGIRAENLNLVIPTIGSITGNGTIGANQSLDFHMIAKLNSLGGAAGGSSNPLSSITSMISGGQKGGAGSIPFLIQGTSKNPVFVPDLAAAARGYLQNPTQATPGAQDLGGILGGLLGKKKKP